MLRKNLVLIMAIILLAGFNQANAGTVNLQAQKPDIKAEDLKPAEDFVYKEVNPLNLVAQPQKYLNKRVKMKAKFDKFTAIGLDYPPINRSAKAHISFLIKRENVTDYNIPLSELKLILKREYAEKELVNIESGDEIEIYGNMFSCALGDPWVDVEKITILTKKADKNKTETKKADVNPNDIIKSEVKKETNEGK